MEYRQLGKSALKVSTLCLGTMNFGPRTSEEESFAIMDDAMEAGINFFDTANQYGGKLGVGATAVIVGKWLTHNPQHRERIVLATKVHQPMSDDINDRGLSARHIRMACEASLKRLNVDHIDLYQMHHIDRAAPAEEIWQAMDQLISQGKITYVGSSNFPGWKIVQMNEKAQVRHSLGLVSEQSLYNLVERSAELEVIPACKEYGLGVITWSPLSGGLLALNDDDGTGRRQSKSIKSAAQSRSDQLSRYGDLCKSIGETPSALALAWLLNQSGVTSNIIGPGSRAQLASVLHVPTIQISQETLATINEIFPPIGSAPEAYAW